MDCFCGMSVAARAIMFRSRGQRQANIQRRFLTSIGQPPADATAALPRPIYWVLRFGAGLFDIVKIDHWS
jgi:hypothetical protein